jgi:hypothetical protein
MLVAVSLLKFSRNMVKVDWCMHSEKWKTLPDRFENSHLCIMFSEILNMFSVWLCFKMDHPV